MPNEEHVRIARQGAEAISEWRQQHPKEKLDLRDAPLTGVQLSSADLSWADLSRANLTGANIVAADLRRANLYGANLFGAVARQADLRGALLFATSLTKAVLRETDFREARCNGTIFADCDLSECIGLETVRHFGPSFIGVETLWRSHGQVSEEFLRGSGVPETLIIYLPSLMTTVPFGFYTCFISYADCDLEFAKKLYEDLQGKGVRCWLYPESAVI